MAINSNDSKSTVVAVRKLYTGMARMTVLAINPTKELLEKIYGRELEKEPAYIDTDEKGVTRVRIEIHAQLLPVPGVTAENTTVKFAYFVKKQEQYSERTSKHQYINKYGKTCWAVTEEDLDTNQYFINENARIALQGEEDFTNKFLRVWANVAYSDKLKGECRIDTWGKIFQGDFSELHGFVKPLSINVFRGLLGVRTTDDGKQYQDVYTKYFERDSVKANTGIIKALNDERGNFRSDYNNSLDLQEYIGSTATQSEPDKEVPSITSRF